ncbi:MAG TPA: FtsX-like permease family protein [Verrucomicrobiae bacterium]|nr:FtsX-like permease family protein [Verrucomicrobiae bacterium]
MKFLHLIGSHLRHKKLRTALTLLSITVAFVLFGFLSAIRQALVGGVQMAGADRLIVRNKISIIQMLPESYQARINRIPGVDFATHQTWFGGIYQDPKNFFMQSPVVPQEFLKMYPEILLSPAESNAWLQTRTGAIVGRKTAERFHWKIGDQVPIQSTIWAKEDGSRTWVFDIVGIFDGRDKNTDTTPLFFRYDYFDEARRYQKGQVGWYIIRIHDPAQAAAVAQRVDAEFANSPAETRTEPEGAFIQAFANQTGNIVFIVAAILSAVFFTLLLVVGNTMAQAVRERTGEFGALKAMGFSNGQILALVLAESCLLAIPGGAFGLSLAWLIIARGDPTHGLLPMFYLPAHDIFVGLGISLLLGLGAGIFPALKARRLQVAEALRRL